MLCPRGATWLVTATQMQRVESLLFAQGLPVAALMEKAGLGLAVVIEGHYPRLDYPRVCVLAGPGHNGGDALVVARELLLAGRQVWVCCPVSLGKDLTRAHRQFFESLGGQVVDGTADWPIADLWVDGLFGLGLTRNIEGAAARAIEQVNAAGKPVVAIDLPSGLSTDTGTVLGTAIRAGRTLCLGLWKQGIWQDKALPYVGNAERIDLGITDTQIAQALDCEVPRLLSDTEAKASLPLSRPPLTHKYAVGTTLVVSGSHRYGGAPQLVALGARASGTGMLTLAVPASLRQTLLTNFPEAVFAPCPETEQGTIAAVPLDLTRYDALAFGPGLGAIDPALLERTLDEATGVLVLDADGLNALVGHMDWLISRRAPTVLTPHPGEFRRLFADLDLGDRFEAAQEAARRSGAWVVLKGAHTVMASPEGRLWVQPIASSALARGGSGDVLAGLIAGLAAQTKDPGPAVLGGVWWHARAGAYLASRRTLLGVTPQVLAEELIPFLAGSVQTQLPLEVQV